MCSAHRLTVLYICVKFPDIFRMVSELWMLEVGSADRWMDRQTDTQNVGEYNIVSVPQKQKKIVSTCQFV